MDSRHPLDPLTLDEIQQACDMLKTEKSLGNHYKFAQVVLEEPLQSDILHHTKSLHRIVFICILDSKLNETYEANVDLTTGKVIRFEKLPFDKAPYGQAPIMLSDYQTCDRIVKSDPTWRNAMIKRGLSDDKIDLIQIDPFAPGYFDIEEEKGKRLVRAVSYYRDKITDNGYARPIEGVVAVVDLIKQSVLRVDDDGRHTPIPKEVMNYDEDSISESRPPPKPLDITQPEGPSFKVNGWEVEWLGWKFRIGFTPREGLVLHQISFDNRSIIYRASIPEMVVPYADPSKTREFQAAFDAGENGFGSSSNQLKLGCDCLGQIHYFNVPSADESGNKKLMKHAICMHEEDAGILWKHTDTRTGICETRRARQLIVSFFITIDNYDYGFYYIFGQDGSFKVDVKLTGILQTAAVNPGMTYEWGSKLSDQLVAPMHQHLFNARLHMAVDGPNNSVDETEFKPLPISDRNPNGVAFGVNHRKLTTEQACFANEGTQRSWAVYNPNVFNKVGEPVAYKLVLPQTPLLLADPRSYIYKRAQFATSSLWVNPYHPEEKFPSGNYPNQHAGGDGVSKYVQQNRSVDNTPLVLSAVFGTTHKARLEEFPVMPVKKVGIELIPFGFFNRNPALGVPYQHNEKSVKQDGVCCLDVKR